MKKQAKLWGKTPSFGSTIFNTDSKNDSKDDYLKNYKTEQKSEKWVL